MSQHFIVCPPNENIIRSFRSKAIVVKTDDQNSVCYFSNVIKENNKVHCIELHLNRSLSAFKPDDSLLDIPLHIWAPKMGNFMELVMKRKALDQLSARYFLSTSYAQNFTDIQILSSLGYETGIYFDTPPYNWQDLTDLMYYTLYGKVRHGSIEPFKYIVDHYRYSHPTDFGSVYFENPRKYLHVDNQGRVALSAKDLAEGNFILDDLEKISEIETLPAYQDYLHRWQQIFLESQPCAFCPGWRICLGKFSHLLENNPGCQDLFSELIDIVETIKEQQAKIQPRELCQP